MGADKARLTVDELFETLKRTALPTVLVEGKDDIIFYRRIEEDLKHYGVDMLPAGNKAMVLELCDRLGEIKLSAPIIFVVDKDLWVHLSESDLPLPNKVITTSGYSIENDAFNDGELGALLDAKESSAFTADLNKFLFWYALALSRHFAGEDYPFRTHPGKVLDDDEFYISEATLRTGEVYPEALLAELVERYTDLLRGKSLFGIFQRQISAPRRPIKFSTKHLIEIGVARKGGNFNLLRDKIEGLLSREFEAANTP